MKLTPCRTATATLAALCIGLTMLGAGPAAA